MNLQDLRFHLNTITILKLFRHNNGNLMYIPEDQHNSNVKRIAKENKEVKLHGQEEKHKDRKYIDPREVKIREEKPKVRKYIDPREVSSTKKQ